MISFRNQISPENLCGNAFARALETAYQLCKKGFFPSFRKLKA